MVVLGDLEVEIVGRSLGAPLRRVPVLPRLAAPPRRALQCPAPLVGCPGLGFDNCIPESCSWKVCPIKPDTQGARPHFTRKPRDLSFRFPRFPTIKLRRSFGHQLGTKSVRRPGDKPVVNRRSCSVFRFAFDLIQSCFRGRVQDDCLRCLGIETKGRAPDAQPRPPSPSQAPPRPARPGLGPAQPGPRPKMLNHLATPSGIMVTGRSAICGSELGRSVVAVVGLRERLLTTLRSFLIQGMPGADSAAVSFQTNLRIAIASRFLNHGTQRADTLVFQGHTIVHAACEKTSSRLGIHC